MTICLAVSPPTGLVYQTFLVIDNAPVHRNAVSVEEPALLKRGQRAKGKGKGKRVRG